MLLEARLLEAKPCDSASHRRPSPQRHNTVAPGRRRHDGTVRRSRALLLTTLLLVGSLTTSSLAFSAESTNGSGASLIDETLALGVDFQHRNGMNGRFLMVENVGAGVALLDVDDDGDLDIYAVQGGELDKVDGSDPTLDELWLGEPGAQGGWSFVDATTTSGVEATGYGMGIVTGDFDGNGSEDAFVLNYGPNQLWLNRGDGRFSQASLGPEIAGAQWSVSGAAADFDGDGDLDIYVANYLDYQLDDNRVCRSASGSRDYCAPNAYRPVADQLLRNRGDGTFEDVSSPSGIAGAAGPALGVLAADLDADGALDFYVANDGAANFWWRQQRGTFEEAALGAGLALNSDGAAEASMGIIGADLDGDGVQDLVVTHLAGETHTLYRQTEPGLFDDVTVLAGLARPSRRATGFGIVALDVNGDRRLDLYVANGAVRTLEDLEQKGDPYPLHQPNQMFRNTRPKRPGLPGRFEELSPSDHPVLAASEVSRGVAGGDLDNDGDTDLVVSNNNGRLRILLSQLDPSEWTGFAVRSPDAPGRAHGARVAITLTNGERLVRFARSSEGYASAHDRRIPVSLPAGVRVRFVDVEWIGGGRERFEGPFDLNRYVTLEPTSSQSSPAGDRAQGKARR